MSVFACLVEEVVHISSLHSESPELSATQKTCQSFKHCLIIQSQVQMLLMQVLLKAGSALLQHCIGTIA